MSALEKIAIWDLKFSIVFGPAFIVFLFSLVASWEELGIDGGLAYVIAAVPAIVTAYVVYRLLQ